MADIPVRYAVRDDADLVARMLHAFNTEFAAPTPGAVVLRERVAALLDGGESYVVLGGDPVVGLALVTRRRNVWYAGPVELVDELYVAPERRAEGVGSAILERIFADARARGVALVEVNVDEGDVAARRFYQRHGFAETERGSAERAFYLWREFEAVPGAI